MLGDASVTRIEAASDAAKTAPEDDSGAQPWPAECRDRQQRRPDEVELLLDPERPEVQERRRRRRPG